jgi:hypothetical protein
MNSNWWRLTFWLYAGGSLAIVVALSLFFAFLDRQAERTWREALGRQAVEALALDASRTFPQEVVTIDARSIKVWSANVSPCIFTTNQYVIEGNARSLLFDDWPKGAAPTCEDFFSSRVADYNPQTTVPQNCLPVLTYPNRGGRKNTFLVLAADGAALEDLTAGGLSAEGRFRVAEQGLVPGDGFYEAELFVRLGGLDQVSVKLDEKKSCDGFALFRFSTDVAHLDTTRKTLEAGGYRVGLK